MDTTAAVTAKNHDRRGDEIRTILAHRAGGFLDAAAVADATIGTLLQMDTLLAPVIGTQGADVIFRRALYLTSGAFPWLSSGEEPVEIADLLSSLQARLEKRPAAEAADAGSRLLACFTQLLETLIGDILTESVLGPIWACPAASSELEIES